MRLRVTQVFCWIAVSAWAVGLGAKLFDLVVLAGAWGANPPASLALYPYGKAWPWDPGDFFQPLSAFILLAALGALISGWKLMPGKRLWLWLPVLSFLLIWIATPTLFWPMINELYAIAHGRLAKTDAEQAALVRRWFVFDSMRIGLIAIGFVATVKGMTLVAVEQAVRRGRMPVQLTGRESTQLNAS